MLDTKGTLSIHVLNHNNRSWPPTPSQTHPAHAPLLLFLWDRKAQLEVKKWRVRKCLISLSSSPTYSSCHISVSTSYFFTCKNESELLRKAGQGSWRRKKINERVKCLNTSSASLSQIAKEKQEIGFNIWTSSRTCSLALNQVLETCRFLTH